MYLGKGLPHAKDIIDYVPYLNLASFAPSVHPSIPRCQIRLIALHSKAFGRPMIHADRAKKKIEQGKTKVAGK